MTYNSLPPTACPSGIRAQIVSSLTTPQIDISKNGKLKIKIELPKLLGWKGMFRSLLSQLSNVHIHKPLLEC